ncbi:MAG: TetR/AcrR family transcriptional regulator [Anaerolineae bacterium]|jgi:AcrR family transcriptional regulator|nr:TetR/AcrR family transcriptional regulator [Anaerolineae bacterium]
MSPEDETRERIVQGAAQVFAQKGYEGATTRAIAQAAGVNEVTLFRHFGNKKNIFMAVIERFSALPGLEVAMKERLTGDYRQDLTKLGTHFLTTMLKQRKAILMSLCTAERLPEIREVVAQPPTQQQQMLSGYLRQQIARGVVRDLPSPELAAKMFFGMLFEFAISQPLITGTPLEHIPPEEVVAQVVDIFVQGTMKSQGASNAG